jgi:hypothetical protein
MIMPVGSCGDDCLLERADGRLTAAACAASA